METLALVYHLSITGLLLNEQKNRLRKEEMKEESKEGRKEIEWQKMLVPEASKTIHKRRRLFNQKRTNPPRKRPT